MSFGLKDKVLEDHFLGLEVGDGGRRRYAIHFEVLWGPSGSLKFLGGLWGSICFNKDAQNPLNSQGV